MHGNRAMSGRWASNNIAAHVAKRRKIALLTVRHFRKHTCFLSCRELNEKADTDLKSVLLSKKLSAKKHFCIKTPINLVNFTLFVQIKQTIHGVLICFILGGKIGFV